MLIVEQPKQIKHKRKRECVCKHCMEGLSMTIKLQRLEKKIHKQCCGGKDEECGTGKSYFLLYQRTLKPEKGKRRPRAPKIRLEYAERYVELKTEVEKYQTHFMIF
jgi:hypothetical protein